MPLTRRIVTLAALLIMGILGASGTAVAGTVGFDISADDATLTLTEHGDETAFDPRVYVLELDGSWRELPRGSASSQLGNGQSARFDGRPLQRPTAHPVRVVQVRFVDKAGVGFGQLATLGNWPTAPALPQSWSDGWLVLTPAHAVATSWVLSAPVQLTPPRSGEPPPRAVHVDWATHGPAPRGETRIRLDLTHDCPVLLLHQTANRGATSYAMQWATPTHNPAFPQRPFWLGVGGWWFVAAALTLGTALVGAAKCFYRQRPNTK